jgi:DNA-binding NarL/FixJ family response regulator
MSAHKLDVSAETPSPRGLGGRSRESRGHKLEVSAETPLPARILIVDDHPLVRTGLAEILRREVDFCVCGEAQDRCGALKAIPATQPDLVIGNLVLHGSDGLEFIKDIHARFPKVLVLAVAMQEEELLAERVLRAGASGYVTKEDAATCVAQAVRQVLGGGFYVSQTMAARLAAQFARCGRDGSFPGLDSLSDRELQIFELLGEGLSRHQVAERLHLDINTVETYRARIKEKLQLKDALELLQYAIRSSRVGHLNL